MCRRSHASKRYCKRLSGVPGWNGPNGVCPASQSRADRDPSTRGFHNVSQTRRHVMSCLSEMGPPPVSKQAPTKQKLYKVVPFMIRTVEVPAAVMLYFKSQPKKVWNVKRYKEICTHIYIYVHIQYIVSVGVGGGHASMRCLGVSLIPAKLPIS